MTKLLLTAVITVFCSLFLKEKSRVFALALTLAGIGVIIFCVLSDVFRIVSKMKELSSQGGAYIGLMIKVLSVTLITQGVSDICRDNGENALASVCEFGAKIAVLSLIFPLFETVITTLGGIVK